MVITLTDSGLALRDQAVNVPGAISQELCLSQEEAMLLYKVLYKILDNERMKEL